MQTWMWILIAVLVVLALVTIFTARRGGKNGAASTRVPH